VKLRRESLKALLSMEPEKASEYDAKIKKLQAIYWSQKNNK
jgi:hypothetical protein